MKRVGMTAAAVAVLCAALLVFSAAARFVRYARPMRDACYDSFPRLGRARPCPKRLGV